MKEMVQLMRVHTIPLEGHRRVVFCPDNLRFFVTSNAAADIAERIAKGDTFEQASVADSQLTKEAFESVKSKLTISEPAQTKPNERDVLQRLVINISNDCNMRCRYCYANCGVYSGKKSIMTPDILLAALDYFFSSYRMIGVVQLFGGEPTMNIEAMKLACRYIKVKSPDTQIGTVTNGTLVNEELIDLVHEYGINVTVSIDVEKLHDELRPLMGGKPSWDLVKNNIRRLQSRTCQPTQFELTYTKLHDERGISIVDVLSELKSEYGSVPVHVTPVCTDNLKYQLTSRDAFINSVHDIFVSKRAGNNLDFGILSGFEQCLKYRFSSEHLCNAGFGTIAVSTTGEIYPCFYYIDKKDYVIASVVDPREDIDDALRKTAERYLARTKSSLGKCSECFASSICHGCLGSNLDTTGDEFSSSEEQCDMTRRLLEELLKELVGYARNRED